MKYNNETSYKGIRMNKPSSKRNMERMYKRVSKNALEQWNELRWEAFRIKDDEESNRMMSGNADNLTRLSYLHEYGTLRLNFGRQTGNSWFVVEFAREFSNETAIVTINEKTKNKIPEDGHYLRINSLTLNELYDPNKTAWIRPRYLIIDNSDLISDQDLIKIYKVAAEVRTELIILC